MSGGDSITLKVRLVDKKVFKKFTFFPKKTVREARLHIAKELDVDAEQYGLFLPPRDDQNGIWFRDDYPLDFYGLEGESDQKEALLFSSKEAPLMEFVEFKKRYRPIKVAKGGDQYKTVMVDDTMNVQDAITNIVTQVPISSAITENELFSMNEDEVEVLSGDMTIREQGYVGECTTGLLKSEKGEVNLFVKVPYFEGWIMRKRGGNFMKGLKNWNKRWYTLKKNKLVYHKAKGFGPEMGCILMKTVQAVRPCVNTVDIPSKYTKSCFEVVTPARTFIMLASNANEMKKWVDTLDFSRRMFAYETHFFGVAKGNRMSMAIKGGANGYNSDTDESEDEQVSSAAAKKAKEQQAAAEREAAERAKQEEQERELERKRKEEEERIAKQLEEEKRIAEQKRKEEEEELLRKQEEFLAKQQQLELEKQKQLQDQLDEERKLEELMLQMEMEQDERLKLKRDQERLEQEREEISKRLAEEQEKLRVEKERLEKERIETEERLEKEREEERKRIQIQEEERIEREKKAEEERVEREKKAEQERLERLAKEEEERIERERQEKEEEDLLEQLEREKQEKEQQQSQARRLQSTQARLEAIEQEVPELKLLLANSTQSTPENLLIAWANYITQDTPLGKRMNLMAATALVTKDLSSNEAILGRLELYCNILHKLEPQLFSIEEFNRKPNNAEKATYLVESLQNYGITTVTVEQLLSTDHEVHTNVLLTIYEEADPNWQEEFQTQLVSKRLFASKFIAHTLSSVTNLHIPTSPYEMLGALSDGQILCHLINTIFKGTIDQRVINRNIELNRSRDNLLIAINASKALGAKHSYLASHEFVQNLNPLEMNSVLFEIVELCLLESANPSRNRSLFNLMRAETRNSFKSLDHEKIMLRWFNYHLRKVSSRQINNFSDDMEDCENYAYLFSVIAPKVSRKEEILAETDWEKRAEIVLDMAAKVGCIPNILSPKDIVDTENSKLNLFFVADIMRVCPALPSYKFGVDEELDDFVAKSSEQSNNDPQLIEWINGMGLGVEIHNTLDDLKDGTVFLKVFDKVMPAGTVDQKKLKIVPNSVFKKLELLNYTMEICHKLKLNVAGIAGTDLLNGDVRANRAILNQVRRYLGDKVTVDSATLHQTQALKWANSKIPIDSKVKHIQSFKDQFLQDSLFFLALLDSLNPGHQNKQYILVSQTEESFENNARYFLTLAWNAAIPLMVQWDDVVKVRSKSIKHIIETLQEWSNQPQSPSTSTTTTTISSSIKQSSSASSSSLVQQPQQTSPSSTSPIESTNQNNNNNTNETTKSNEEEVIQQEQQPPQQQKEEEKVVENQEIIPDNSQNDSSNSAPVDENVTSPPSNVEDN